ncbi:MAG: GNAT family N-acetyltransferase [Acidimicrobiales bacterium]|nr:GNAT family N-acetyltransferase [Acidimicrobiales bacterium]
MLALTDLTKPGPFLPGTARMGDFFGIRHDGALVAMAGTRFATDTWCEVSAVCTHPDARGRGYGATLTEWITARIQASGRQAFLHVTATNTSAKALYDKLGFRERREVTVAAFIRSA